MMWLVFRSRWAALAWVVMVCAGIFFRLELASPAMLGGGVAAMAASAHDDFQDQSATRHHHRDRADDASDSAEDSASEEERDRPDPYSGRVPDEYRNRPDRW